MSDGAARVLLDTHALIWLVSRGLSAAARDAVRAAEQAGGLLMSAVSVWELGLLLEPKGRKPRLDVGSSYPEFVADLRGLAALVEVPLTSAMAMESIVLPGDFHADPADRFLVATARVLDVPIMTRDRAILAYAQTGAVKVVPC